MISLLLILLLIGGFFVGSRQGSSMVLKNIMLGIASFLTSSIVVGAFLTDVIYDIIPDNDSIALAILGICIIISTCLIFVIFKRIMNIKYKEIKSTTLDADLMDRHNNDER